MFVGDWGWCTRQRFERVRTRPRPMCELQRRGAHCDPSPSKVAKPPSRWLLPMRSLSLPSLERALLDSSSIGRAMESGTVGHRFECQQLEFFTSSAALLFAFGLRAEFRRQRSLF